MLNKRITIGLWKRTAEIIDFSQTVVQLDVLNQILISFGLWTFFLGYNDDKDSSYNIKNCYRIYSAIRRVFLSRMTKNNWISPMKCCYNTRFTPPKQS